MATNLKPIPLDRFIRSAIDVGLTANAAYLAARGAGYRIRRQTFYQRYRQWQRKLLDH